MNREVHTAEILHCFYQVCNDVKCKYQKGTSLWVRGSHSALEGTSCGNGKVTIYFMKKLSMAFNPNLTESFIVYLIFDFSGAGTETVLLKRKTQDNHSV